MTKKVRISEDAYNRLKEARLPGEDINDTLRRLIREYEQYELTKFARRQKHILESEDFTPIDESNE